MFVLTVIRSGTNTLSVPSYYTALSNHTATDDNRPPNDTFWQPGDGSIDVPGGVTWVIFNDLKIYYCGNEVSFDRQKFVLSIKVEQY